MKVSMFAKKSVLSVITLLALTSCGGGGGGTSSTYGIYHSPTVSAQQFVDSLNDVDLASFYDESYVRLYADETDRSLYDSEDWFVIYDAEHGQNIAVSLQYIRSIQYYDYYSTSYSTAEEFRNIQEDDIAYNYGLGDGYGDDYEVVDYNLFNGYYYGRDTGLAYEDEAQTYDVSLMNSDVEMKAMIKKAASISFSYSVDMKTSLSLVTLGTKVEKMLGKNGGDLTEADSKALMSDIEKVTGASMAEFQLASEDETTKEDVVSKVADHIGTSADNLQNRILPELFGIEL